MKEFLNYTLYSYNDDVSITVGSIFLIILGYIFARVINYLLRRVLKAYFKKRSVDVGRSYTILQLIKYFIFVVVFISLLNIMGIRLNYLMAGSAALLVGVGIGLQKTFNDFFSGLILLVDGTIEVGDVLDLNGEYGTVKFIGLRTSKFENINKHMIIIPNSELINNRVKNLSHNDNPVRFSIKVGVSYGSDIKHVEKVLLDVIDPFTKYKMNYSPSVNLQSFGDSSINFVLFFYTTEAFLIDKVLSDIRKEIFVAFKREGIAIPFPQRDLWLKTDNSESIQKIVDPNKA